MKQVLRTSHPAAWNHPARAVVPTPTTRIKKDML